MKRMLLILAALSLPLAALTPTHPECCKPASPGCCPETCCKAADKCCKAIPPKDCSKACGKAKTEKNY